MSDPRDLERGATSELARLAGGGDPERFQLLYDRVAPALYAWADLRLRRPLRLHVEPVDLVQEVWLRAVARLADFDPDRGRFRSWIFSIAKHVLLEAYRLQRRLPRTSHPAGSTKRLFTLDGCPDDVSTASQVLARDDAMRHFVASACELSPVDRRLLLLCGLEHKSCAHAARQLELTEAAALKRWQRLRSRLRERPWARRLLEAS